MQVPLGDIEDRIKYHLIVQNEVKKPLSFSGLNLHSLIEMNMTLQGKWLRRFMKEEGVLWRRIIVAKFEMEENRCLINKAKTL